MKHLVLAAIATLACGAAVAQEAPNPTALIHADAGSIQVQGGAAVSEGSVGINPGDVVTIDGTATVTYSNGCTATVSGQFTMPAAAPACAPTSKPIKGDGVWVAAGAAGVVAVGAAVSGGSDDKPSSP